jgi:hypothetical protein
MVRMNAGNSFKSVAEDFIEVRMEDSGKAESTIRKAQLVCIPSGARHLAAVFRENAAVRSPTIHGSRAKAEMVACTLR